MFQKHKKWLVTLILVWTVLLMLFLVRLHQAGKAAQRTAGFILEQVKNNVPLQPVPSADTLYELTREILWLENQLALSRSDSMSLGINLRDQVLQVQLKGTVLFQSPLYKQDPVYFLQGIDYPAYESLFGKPASIVSEYANIEKKPIRKVLVHALHNGEDHTDPDTIPEDPIQWKFELNNYLQVVIRGVPSHDSLRIHTFTAKLSEGISFNPFSVQGEKYYTPTLHIWLNDKDARAIYRALPERSKVVFLN